VRAGLEEDLSLSVLNPLRAPRENGRVLAVPPLAEVPALLEANRRRLDEPGRGPDLGGVTLAELRQQARRAALAAARDYLARGGEPLPQLGQTAADQLLLAGHQPELYHPGVWVKNLALYGLARAHGRTPLNLVVDNDTVKSTTLRVPVPPHPGHDSSPRLVTVPFDRWSAEVPYEERAVAEPELFHSFADRVADLMKGWPFEPLLPELWAEVRRKEEQTPLLGECLVAGRRALERRWGCHNLEVPLSILCGTAPFHWFACHLLSELPRFHALYNAAVHDYRVRNGIRSRNHPVPDLAAEGDWLEAPFWGWRAGRTRRGRLFARPGPQRIELRANAEPWPALPLAAETPLPRMAAAWGQLEGQGFKVRTRALTTTLYARLLLADLFVHGIGGAKYDELSDELIRRFYGCEPPSFLTLSATLWLPIEHEDGAELLLRRRRLARQCRDLHWNPQRHLDGSLAGDPTPEQLSAQKQAWIDRPANTPAERRSRFETLRRVTESLRKPLQAEEELAAVGLRALDRQLAGAAILERRDYSFVLYPASVLRPFAMQFLAAPSPARLAAGSAD
jgi:hypothetical protein